MHRNRRKTNISESQIQVHGFWTQNTLMTFWSTTSSQIFSHNLLVFSWNGISKRSTGDLQSIVVLPTSKYVAQFGHEDPSLPILDKSLLFPPLKVFVQNEKERWVNIKIAHNRALKQWVEYFMLSKIKRKGISSTKSLWTIWCISC